MRELYKPSKNFPTFENWAFKTIFPLFENFPTFQKLVSHFSHFWDFLIRLLSFFDEKYR